MECQFIDSVRILQSFFGIQSCKIILIHVVYMHVVHGINMETCTKNVTSFDFSFFFCFLIFLFLPAKVKSLVFSRIFHLYIKSTIQKKKKISITLLEIFPRLCLFFV